jgi:hypothetical protein
MKADKLASFRIDSQLWEQFQAIAKENNNTASALLVAYIKQVVSPNNVITSNLVVNTSSEVNSPSLSIHDIDSRIDAKISQSIQDINTPSIQNIEDLIDSRIGGSVREGDIKSAIAHSYKSTIDQFNGHLEELQHQIRELQKQFEELSVSPPSAPVPPSADIKNLLGIGDILAGNPYDLNYLNNHIGYRLNEHKSQIETALKIKLNLSDPKYICREFNKIVRGLGFTIENKQINKIETYWIVK